MYQITNVIKLTQLPAKYNTENHVSQLILKSAVDLANTKVERKEFECKVAHNARVIFKLDGQDTWCNLPDFEYLKEEFPKMVAGSLVAWYVCGSSDPMSDIGSYELHMLYNRK